jgi:hypothetical protein
MRPIPILLILAILAILAIFPRAVCAIDSPRLSLDPTVTFSNVHALFLDGYRTAPSDFRVTLYWENDGNWAKPFDSHDRHYTAGVGMSLAWRAPWVDDLLQNVPSFGNEFSRSASYAMGFVGALTMYTPDDITDPAPQYNDRPFAGYTYGGLFFQRARRAAPPEFGFPPPALLLDPNSYSAFESHLRGQVLQPRY